MFNEWYARDISKKRRLSNKIRGTSGEPLSKPPYGYQQDPQNPKHWIVDEEAARIVRRIFAMSLEGYGSDQIATVLDKEQILAPMAYWRSKGINRSGRAQDPDHTHWASGTIIKMLAMQEYCGDLINFKTYSKSYKNKKRLPNDPENIVGLQYILDKHKKGKRDRVSYAKVELPHHNSAKGDHIPHEQEYNTRHGVSAIADEVCREIRR